MVKNDKYWQQMKLTEAWTSPGGERWIPRPQETGGSTETAPTGEESGEYLQEDADRSEWKPREKRGSVKNALPVFGSRISGDRCEGGVPGEKCSLL